MQLDDLTTEAAIIAELGRRLGRHRVEADLTREELAARAGVGASTLQRLERGESVQLTSLVKVLRALGLLAALDAAIDEPVESPLAALRRERDERPRRRVRHRQRRP